MANELLTQIIQDGPRNISVKISGVLTDSDLAQQVIVDPALLAGIDNTGTRKAGHLLLEKISHNIEDQLAVALFWDATTPVRIESLTGRGLIDYHDIGGLPDNSGVGSTGKILLETQGFSVGTTLSFALTIRLVKQQR